MDNTFSFIALWDIYRGLLTPKQQEIADLYFNYDLSLSEIAEQKGITRQGVSECLQSCRRQLAAYEDRLHIRRQLTESSLAVSAMMADAGRWAESFRAAHPELSSEIAALEEILNKDYSEEAEAVTDEPQAAEILQRDFTKFVCGRKKTGEE